LGIVATVVAVVAGAIAILIPSTVKHVPSHVVIPTFDTFDCEAVLTLQFFIFEFVAVLALDVTVGSFSHLASNSRIWIIGRDEIVTLEVFVKVCKFDSRLIETILEFLPVNRSITNHCFATVEFVI